MTTTLNITGLILTNMRYVFYISIIMLLTSCLNRGKKQVEDIMLEMQTKSVVFPNTMRAVCNGKDTISDILDNKIKLIIYYDSETCQSCAVSKLSIWEEYNLYAEKMNLSIIHVFSPKPKDFNSIFYGLKNFYTDKVAFIDKQGDFIRSNKHIPSDNRFHCFLLNKDNKVVLVGNPTHNKKLKQLFFQKTQELSRQLQN